MRFFIPLLTAAAALGFGVSIAEAQQTLKTVQDRGSLICGVSQGLEGFSFKDDKGDWSGFDVDFCRALAAAIFNDPSKVQYVPLSAAERFDALKNKQIDVLSRNSTWTMGREIDFGRRLRRGRLLRRAGVPRSQEPQADFSARTRRQQGLRAVRNDVRAQLRRLLRIEPHELRDRPRRDGRRRPCRLSGRQVQRADERRVRGSSRCACRWRSPATTPSCPT